MTNSKTTKRALFSSVIALILCCSMLVGTTFAWFTDSVESANNIITAGNLDVEVFNDEGKNIAQEPALFEDILWEPGVVAYEELVISNEGSLALQYNLGINFSNQNRIVENGKGLASVLKFAIVKENEVDITDRNTLISSIDEEAWHLVSQAMAPGNEEPTVDPERDVRRNPGQLYPQDNADGKPSTAKHYIVIWWEPSASDNDYNVYNGRVVDDYAETQKNELHITLGVTVFATQLQYESDSFGPDYDGVAVSGIGGGYAPAAPGAEAIPVEVRNASGYKVGAMVVFNDSLVDPSKPLEVVYEKSDYVGNFTIADGMETHVVDITVLNLKEDNQTPVKAYIRIDAGKDPSTVKLYHYDTEITDFNYNPTTGYVSFESLTFSPFTVVYDAESVYVPPVVEDPEDGSNPSDLPEANVTRTPKYENADLEWGNYGQWSPTEGLDSRLEAVYTFSCIDDLDAAKASPYANWYCDFYVMLDRDLGPNQIFLGGNYGDFGWIGFHNGDVTLKANEELPLLGSVTVNDWTYLDVVEFVKTFICGVGDVDDALAGATFTVMLRLTNPDDLEQFYNVATINYTFTAEEDNAVTDEAGLKEALAAGETEIKIKGNITLTEGLNASNVTLVGTSEDAGINFNGHNIGGTGKITYKNLNLTTVSLPYAPENGERYGWYGGIDYLGHSVANYVNCTITGVFTTYSQIVNATDCTFNSYVQDGEEFYNIFMYSSGTVNAKNCTFMYRDRAIKIYSEGSATFVLNIDGGKFVATDDYSVNKALINIDANYLTSATINVKGVTIDEKLVTASLHNADGNAKVTVTVTP